MAATQQPPTTPITPAGQACTSCGAPLAPDQRYCLSCGTRRGEPRVPSASAPQAPEAPSAPEPARQSDVSPLAAVIGIALLGGMLLIGVLIGRGSGDDTPPAPIVQVGEPANEITTPPTGAENGGEPAAAITSAWPAGTDGFTIQLTTVAKAGATEETVNAAKEKAVTDGAADAAVLDSDLYASLPPGNYVIYSGVYTDRRSAEVALKRLTNGFPKATVVEVSSGGEEPAAEVGQDPTTGATEPSADPVAPAAQQGADADVPPGAGGENEIPPSQDEK